MRIFSLIIMIFFTACNVNKPVSQGISGTIQWFEGDLMPGIDKPPVKGIPIEREILIYEATRMEDCVQHDGFFHRDLKTNLIKTTTSNQDGVFNVFLEPGVYSVLIKEDAGLFGNLYDDTGVINPVVVNPGKLTRVSFRVDYMAAY